MTSMGLTTATASVTPAERPANHDIVSKAPKKGNLKKLHALFHLPKKVALLVTLPFSSASMPLYDSYEVNRMAIFGMIPPNTAPRPLYRPIAVSLRTISAPVAAKPRGLVYHDQISHVHLKILEDLNQNLHQELGLSVKAACGP